MFKRMPMGLAALTFFTVGDAQAVHLGKHKHHRHHDKSLASLSADSVPNCTSYQCKNNMATLGYSGLLQTKFIDFNDQESNSDPAWNSADGYQIETAAYPLAQISSISKPACNSADGCQTGTAQDGGLPYPQGKAHDISLY